MSVLNSVKEERNQQTQRAVVSFDAKGGGWVMWFDGEGIKCDIDNVGTSADDLGITDNDSPDHGIWIWEGHFHCWQDYEGECDVDVRTQEWRKPNAAEWHAIMSGRDPFDLYNFMRPEGKKITVTKPNANEDIFMKEMVAESWMKKGQEISYFQFKDRDKLRAELLSADRGRAPECPKCKGRVEGKHCTGCGYFCG